AAADQRARVLEAHGEADRVMEARDRSRIAMDALRAVTELAVAVVAPPAQDRALVVERADVVGADPDHHGGQTRGRVHGSGRRRAVRAAQRGAAAPAPGGEQYDGEHRSAPARVHA